MSGRDAVLCNECYREQFWLAARGAIALIMAIVAAITLLQRQWLGSAAAIALFAVWFVVAGHLARRAAAERASARVAAKPGEDASLNRPAG